MLRIALDSPATQRNLLLVLLLGAAAACWALLLVPTDMAMAMSPTMGLRAPVFLAFWVVMMVAMMFPSAAPMILTFHRIQSGRRRRGESFVSTWLFVGAYLLVWSAAGLIAYVLATLAEQAAVRETLSAASAARIGGVLLVAAGLFQLTPLKDVCLSKCRSPIGFLMGSWREGRLGAMRMGIEHGIYCLGCCWMLMVALFPLGVMSLAAMALVAVVIFAEKALASGRVAVYATSVLLMLYGAAVIASPALLPTYHSAQPAAAMPGMDKPGMKMPGMKMPGMKMPGMDMPAGR